MARRRTPRRAVEGGGTDGSAAAETGDGAEGRATEADVVAAYRLILGREPDLDGLAHHRRRLAAEPAPTRADLAAELLGSGEFARTHPDLVGPYRSSAETVPADGFVIAVETGDWAVGGRIAAAGTYEPEVTARVRGILGPGDVFVDVGANVGWYSLLACSLVGPAGAVVAVEPNARNGELLRRSRDLNGFTSLELVAGAASDAEEWLALETDASNGRVIPLGAATPAATPIRCSYVVPSFPLDRLLADRRLLGRVRLVKIDVEGVETRVLAGAERLLATARPAVVLEWYPAALVSTGGVGRAPRWPRCAATATGSG